MQRKMMARLIAWKGEKDRKPLLLKGVRQTGKTYLLKEFGSSHFPRLHYFNFEKKPDLAKTFELDLEPGRLLEALSFHSGWPIEVGRDLVVFDEIQEAPRALTSLKYFAEECPKLHLIAAGSLLGLHLSQGSFPVGKVTFETLRPLSFEEFLMAIQDKALPLLRRAGSLESLPAAVHDHLLEKLKVYFITGGLPEVVAVYAENSDTPLKAFELVRKKQSDIVDSYYADIAKHSGKVNAMHIDRVFRSVPRQLSQTQEGAAQRFRFRGVVPGISHYDRLVGAIDWLEAAGLVLKVPILNSGHLPLGGYVKENIFKLLLFDVGLLGFMSDLSPKSILEAEYGGYKGYFAENFVAQELLAYGRSSLYNWQEDSRHEVDFLLEIDGKVVPLEVKSGKVVHAHSLSRFSAKYHPPYELVVSARALEVKEGSQVRFYPLYAISAVL